MSRRRFDHLFVEASVAAGLRLPRYDLWLALHEFGADPERLSRSDALRFCDERLPGFLGARGVALSRRAARALQGEVGRFDPAVSTPYERFAHLAGS
jgi:hypothetical protein